MQMKLTFIGADHEVTGSCHYLEVGNTKLLVDCGMEQGNNVYENAPLPVPYNQIDYVLLTHAHIDHAGLLPWLYAKGFKGRTVAQLPPRCPIEYPSLSSHDCKVGINTNNNTKKKQFNFFIYVFLSFLFLSDK